MKPQLQSCQNQKSLKPSWRDWLKLSLCICVLMVTAATTTAAPMLDEENPVCFFTNVASRLLSTELNVNLTQIEIYPTNQYTPAVHRLLQLAANIYDATTNRSYDDSGFPLPTLFEPVFFKAANGNVYITNYVEYTGLGATLTNTSVLDLGNPNDLVGVQPFSFIYGVPMIVGAKKGRPNFNAFSMESAFQITRKLQLTRTSTNSVIAPPSTYKINQLFDCSISNVFSVECWNSYFSNYTRPTTIWVADHILMGLTNDQTTDELWPPLDSYLNASMTTTNWAGDGLTIEPRGGLLINADSFLITNLTAIALPTSTYLFNNTFNGYHFQPIGMVESFETNPNGLPQPHWWLNATNNLQVVIIDDLSGRAIDYVQLSGPIISRDLTVEILGMSNVAVPSAMWLTNFVSSGVLPSQSLPSGVESQLLASEQYNPTFYAGQSQQAVQQFIDGFRKFLNLTPIYGNTSAFGATNLEIQVPYTPIATPVQIINWQANDPLVHYLASDLFDSAHGVILQNGSTTNLILPTLNERYQPWRVSKQMAAKISPDMSPSNLEIKDPLAINSDSWDFPTNQFPAGGWLGRVHRGTPWQTVYLKAADILQETNGTNIWMNWTGDFDPTDAAAMAPVQDWQLAALLTSLFNTNNLASLFSVNNPDQNAWRGLFDGLEALTNNLPDLALRFGMPQFDSLMISSNSLQVLIMADAIESARSGLPGRFFNGIENILAIPQLTEQSPFLNLSSSIQLTNGISDEAYEIIPSQLLPLLRTDSIGSVVLVNSQPFVQFTGYDGHAYAIQTSSNLVNWTSISTNCPMNGMVSFTNSMMLNANQQFYRSILLR